MTKLLIDIGNSLCKYACVDGRRIKMHGCFAVDQLNQVSNIVERCESAIPSQCYIMSVASQDVNTSVADAVLQHLGYKPILLDKKMPLCGLSSEYNATQLGIDRIAVIIAAWHRLKRASIVIDCGTAVTIDLVNDAGVHKGGMIIPSDALMRFALSKGTARLNYFSDTNKPARLWATNTEDAIAFGCRSALAAAVIAIVQRMRHQFKHDISVLATGGNADVLKNDGDFCAINQLSVIPTLNFEGMMIMIEENIDAHGR
ncbi:MAG: type III pantothenate kinase [Chromatiales bacterium]|nr:type III pantothenate kinase [Chromatiales bacterium]